MFSLCRSEGYECDVSCLWIQNEVRRLKKYEKGSKDYVLSKDIFSFPKAVSAGKNTYLTFCSPCSPPNQSSKATW